MASFNFTNSSIIMKVCAEHITIHCTSNYSGTLYIIMGLIVTCSLLLAVPLIYKAEQQVNSYCQRAFPPCVDITDTRLTSLWGMHDRNLRLENSVFFAFEDCLDLHVSTIY